MGKKILLGVTGSIATYKAAEFVRLLKKIGAEVRVVMTAAAKEFVTPMTFEVLSCHRVYSDIFDQAFPMIHIELAKWADLIVIAPASADIISRLAHANANDLLTSICLATTSPVWLAPAMNQQMWHHPGVQKNLHQCTAYGMRVLPTNAGEQACGDVGLGRMLEPVELLAEIDKFFSMTKKITGRVVITAGATQEAIDPVRYLTNHGSGKMGYALAESFSAHGAEVILISGPTALTPPVGVKFVPVVSAEQMYHAVMHAISHAKVFIATASVVDYRVKNRSTHKIKKTAEKLLLEFEPNADILSAVGQLKPKPFVVGFAAETTDLLKNAEAKLNGKNCDMLIANQIHADGPFGADENEVYLLQKNARPEKFEKMSKKVLAADICRRIIQKIMEA
ncbi:MAG: coaBC [Gammaproteobacteria bacterium]|nr:coaBC [Gammaproteobacteria bacterium]